uniref:Leucine-rich repeat-containing N-terminal plant-type domain-containing protein n=1 Tax=Triticum urartu TaxID=4572 RepID=A0A8R7UR35_TRIUA
MQLPSHSHKNRFLIPFFGLTVVLLVSLAPPTSSCTEQEKSSLIKFLSGLWKDGGLTVSWRSDTDCCSWEGITCSLNRAVTDVSLASQGLEGSTSPFLGNLTSLLRLNLSRNSLSGGLPLELVSSSSIIVLDVSFNRLTGGLHKLPSSTPARPLQVLNISSNLLTGPFPSTIWKTMNNLIALNASNNRFTGAIPTYFCNGSPSLVVLELSFNKLSGSIPPGLGGCSMLTVLRGGYNNLSGTLPDELSNAASLECLSFPNNYLQGVLDSACIFSLRNLRTIDLGGNYFNGRIPDSVGQLKRLEKFQLGHNNLS